MAIFRKKGTGLPTGTPIPRHIAMIMDGNGRWAHRRSLPRTAGHAVGAENFRKVATYCKELGLEYLTIFAFSTENWKRPPEEVATILGLLEKYLHESLAQMEQDRVKMKFFGDTSVLSSGLQKLIAETEERSLRFSGVQVNICLNYGGRDDILRATQRFAEDYAAGNAPKLTEESFGRYLYSADIPDPDLVIRPSGELRISNFLLWQLAYSEFYFTDTLWPDFSTEELNRAILVFHKRKRRYGGL